MTRAMVALAIFLPNLLQARPVHRANKSDAATQAFLRQMNTVSNVEFYYTNRGVLFNAGNGEDEGLFWPRGSGDSYMFGGGLWFATERDLSGKERGLCEPGYDPNSGAGWFIEGEVSQGYLTTGTDGADVASKYISYVSPRYDATSGSFITGSSSVVPLPYYSWPMWDTSSSNTFLRNFYFGDYISDINSRSPVVLRKRGALAKPAVVSQEDIFNIYSDIDTAGHPGYQPGYGYPLGIDVQEEIYSWGYGSYRDMVFIRYKVKNSLHDTLMDCWMAPAFDPDLGTNGQEDANSYVNDSFVTATADSTTLTQLSEPFRSDPTKLNMAVQWSNYTNPPNGKQYGWLGISFLESPVVDSSGYPIANDDSLALHGYGPNSLFQKNQLGLVTCKDWTIANDPSSQDPARYNFVSSGEKDSWDGKYGDQRLMMATGPFNFPPDSSVEATIVLTFAHVSDTSYQQNFGALLLLTELAHQVFGEVDSTQSGGSTTGYFVNNFQVVPQSGVNNSPVMSNLTLHDPYPNPFSNTVTVQYQNANAGEAVATVTDMLGREVQSILLGTVPAGSHTITLDGSGLAAGAYRITVVVGNETESQMVIRN